MIPANDNFEGTWPFQPRFCTASGFKQHFIDEGPRQSETLLLLHGQPTWGYLYRNMIPGLADRYRVVVPDHMGFGKSETPDDREYTLKTHVENLERFLESLALERSLALKRSLAESSAREQPVDVLSIDAVPVDCGFTLYTLMENRRSSCTIQTVWFGKEWFWNASCWSFSARELVVHSNQLPLLFDWVIES